MRNEDVVEVLSGIQGRKIRAVRRILYSYKGSIDSGEGPIEICFMDGSTVLLDGGSDGESLIVKSQPWVDSFAGSLPEENREFVEESGKWTGIEVSEEPPYAQLVGQRVEDVALIRDTRNKIRGVTIFAGGFSVRVEIEGDEVYVNVV
jgi:hypothetical protein